MITIKQAELKSINIKSLVSLDKSLKLVFIINLNEDNNINIDIIKNLLFKPLILNLDIDNNINK